MSLREPLDVRFVDDRAVPGCARAAILPPVEERIDHNALRHERSAVEIVARRLGVGEVIGKDGLVPVPRSVDGFRVRIHQELGRIAPQPLVGGPRPMDPESVALARFHVRQVAMPAECGGVQVSRRVPRRRSCRTSRVRLARAGFGKDGEVRSHPVEGCSEGWRDVLARCASVNMLARLKHPVFNVEP